MAFKKKDTEIVGSKLAAVLPENPKPWYLTWYMLRLNLILLVPLLSSGSIGYDGSMMNGLQTLPQWRTYFDNPAGAVLGVMNAVYPLGKVVGLPIVTLVSDRFGRKTPILAGLVGCVAFSIMQGLARNFGTFLAARALLGFSTTFIGQPSPILIAELAYPTHRGKITAMYNTFFYFGAIFAAWCTYGTFKIESTWSWRIPSLLQGAIPVIQLVGALFLPESPRYLVSKGRVDEARKIFAKHHAGGNLESPLVNFEINEVQETLALESQILSSTSPLDLVRTPANRRRSLIAFIVGWFSQFNGVSVLSYYLTLVLNTIGITEVKDQTLINGLLQIFNWLVAAFLGALMVDRLGRRTLFLASTGGMLCSYIIFTALTAHFIKSGSETVGRTVVGFIFVFYFFYDIAWTPMLQAYPVEIFPYTLRSRGLSVSYMSAYVSLICANQVNPIAMQNIQWKYYIVFCCILAFLLVVIWFLFPETKGHTLEEIAEIFEGPSREMTDSKLEKCQDATADQTDDRASEKRNKSLEHVERSD